jgi:hypothetical protein
MLPCDPRTIANLISGSRDPYMVTGHGAGFVMCWQNDVHLNIAQDPDPRNFMIVDSGSYVLAIPDLGHYARQEADLEAHVHTESPASISSHRQLAIFKKTIMKLNGNVRWTSGLVFERNLDDVGRSFDFIPHYEVVLKHPKYAKPQNGRVSFAVYQDLYFANCTRSMTPIEAFVVTTYTFPLRLLLPMTVSGQSRILSRQKHITVSI